MTDHVHEHTDNGVAVADPAVVTEPMPVEVPFEAVIKRVSSHYADENARLVSALAMAQEENSALRRIIMEGRS